MSHIAKVKIEIRSLAELDQACRRTGFELVRGQQEFCYGLPCEHAIRPQSAAALAEYTRQAPKGWGEFPFGVRSPAGSKGSTGFEIVYEADLEHYCGPAALDIRKSYAAVAAIATARKQGFRVQESRLRTGEIRLVFSK